MKMKTSVSEGKKANIDSGPGKKAVKVNPLAGKSGIGFPIAPEHWRWRAGARLYDMYFTSPDGLSFRSRTQLNEYLAEQAKEGANTPPPDSFQWRITEELLAKNPVLAKKPVARSGAKTPKKRSREEGLSQKEEGSSQKKSHKQKMRAVQASDKVNGNEVELPGIVKHNGNTFSDIPAQQLDSRKMKAEQEFEKLLQFKSLIKMKPNERTLAEIHSSMKELLHAIRTQRKAVEAAETKLRNLLND